MLIQASHKTDNLELNLVAAASSVTIEASGPEGQKIPRFTMLAYTGVPMSLDFWDHPVVVDLQGMQIPLQKRPIRMQHDKNRGVGHTEKIEVVRAGQNADLNLVATGVISRDTVDAKDVVASSAKGFPWQASIGARAVENCVEFVDEGAKCVVNGREWAGPLYHVKKSVLGEISFVDLGADGDTTVSIAAKQRKETEHMEETPEQKAAREKREKEERDRIEAQERTERERIEAEQRAAAQRTQPPVNPVEQMRVQAAAETERIGKIQTICAGNSEMMTKAIREGWSVEKAELEFLRAQRPTAPAVHMGNGLGDNPGAVLECAVMEAGISELSPVGREAFQKSFTPQVHEAARKTFRGGIGLQEVLFEAARANGYQGRSANAASYDLANVLQFAFRRQISATGDGFSLINIGGILSNIAYKFLLDGFNFVERVWPQISAVRSVKDFKTVTSYRLTGNMLYDTVTPGGELKHGDVGEESFTNQAETYGKIIGITRKDIINDDLGALTAIPRKLGRGAALKINQVFWDCWLDEAGGTFWSVAHNNYLTGAGHDMSIAGLTAADVAFDSLKDPDGDFIGHVSTTLLVPSVLRVPAEILMRSTEVRNPGSAVVYPTQNPHAGRWGVVSSRYLTDPTAWWLLCNPSDLAPIEMCFLNGKQEPTIESSDMDFNVLGIQMRGYHDFGVNSQDERSGIKSDSNVVAGS